jgi:hypothetical protein
VGQQGDGNRTIQIDALTDVQLVDAASESDVEGDAETSSAAPPPLPPKRAAEPAGPSRGRAIGLTLVAVVLGTAFALAIVHFVFPTPPPPAATTVTAATVASPPTPPASTTVRRVQLDEELVIRAGGGDDSPPADPPPPTAP